jgi:hypothetical protein
MDDAAVRLAAAGGYSQGLEQAESGIHICIFEGTDWEAWQIYGQVKIRGEINITHTTLRT